MKTRNISDFMSDFGIIDISGSIPWGEIIEFSSLPCMILIHNISSTGDAGLYIATSNGVTPIKGSSAISINGSSSEWLQIKVENDVLKLINNRPNNTVRVRGKIFQP